ncbi:MAG: AsmA family protein, partial [Verrucomicrobia bacterium]|nr:AsmA family protein [Verrucomicrobiota bacterium]
MSSETVRPARRWPLIAGGAAASLVVLYFFLTSSMFLKSFVLPKVSDAIGATIAVDELSLHPFSGLELTKLRVTPTGAASLASIDRVRVHYSLTAILGGTIDVSEVLLENPVITLEQGADGSMNLPKPSGQPTAAAAAPSTPSKPVLLKVRNVVIKDGSFRMTTIVPHGGQQKIEVSGINVSLDQLANGSTTQLGLGASLAVLLPDGASLKGKISGKYDVALNPELLPQTVAGSLRADILSATGALKEASGFSAGLTIDSTATELRQFKLAFEQGGQSFGSVSLSGPFDLAKQEAQIRYQIAGIDRRVLKVAAPMLPYDLGRTAISADGRVDLLQHGKVVASQGRITIADLSLMTPAGDKTPELQIVTEYRTTVNQAEQSAKLETLGLTVTQSGRALINGGLDQPMSLSWAKAGQGVPDSTFKLSINRLETTDWTALAGTNLPSATVSAQLTVRATRDGKDLQATLQTALDNVVLVVGAKTIRGLQLKLATDATLAEFKDLNVKALDLNLQHSGRDLVTLKASAGHNTDQKNSRAEFNGEFQIPALLETFPIDTASFSAGTLRINGKLDAKPGVTNLATDIVLAGLTGHFGELQLQDYQSAISLLADLSGNTLNLQKLQLTAQSGPGLGGMLEASGRYDLAQKIGDFAFKTIDFNERAIGPFVAAALAPKNLVSVSLDVNGKVSLLKGGGLSLQTDLGVSRLVVNDPTGSVPNLDVAQRGSAIDLKNLRLDLGKTALAPNQLVLKGTVDLATNAAPSALSIQSDGLDLTPLYNLLAGPAKTNATPAPAAAVSKTAAPSAEPGEPAPITLPLRQLSVDVNIAKVLLREIEITDWKTRLSLKDSVIAIDPLSLKLNGAPITAKVTANVGVPGYRYDTQLRIDRLSLEPFINSFAPERKGQIHGTLLVNANIRGAGVTGASLSSNLNGGFAVTATNLNLKLGDAKTPLIRTIINVVTALPKLIQNPTAQVGTWLGQLTGGTQAKTGSWVDDLEAEPLDVIDLSTDIGNGAVSLKTARIQSAALRIDARGGLRFAPVLTNSPINIPVTIALSRKISEKAMMLDASTPTNVAYAPLPEFLTVKGTLGNPSPSIDKLALASMGAKTLGRAAAGLGGNLGGKVAGAAGVLGSLLGTPPAAATNAPVTKDSQPAAAPSNAPVTKSSALPAAPTNVPAPKVNPLLNTNTINALIPTNSAAKAIEGLLRGFGKPKN